MINVEKLKNDENKLIRLERVVYDCGNNVVEEMMRNASCFVGSFQVNN